MRRSFAHLPAACVLIFVGVSPALAGELEIKSLIDSVTVYPDGATVTRSSVQTCRKATPR